MSRSTAECWMEIMTIVCFIIIGLMVAYGIVQEIAFFTGNAVIFVIIITGYRILNKIDERP